MFRNLLYKAFSALANKKIMGFEQDAADPAKAQLRRLRSILSANCRTEFGRSNSFETLSRITDDELHDKLSSALPIADYENFRPYLERMIGGEDNVLTHQRPFMFATTSGTTGQPKYIPITDDYMSEFRHASVLSGYHLLRCFPSIADGTVLSMTSSAEEGRTEAGIPYGAMSGALYLREPFLVKRYISPIPYEAYLLRDYDSRYYTILRIALQLPTALFYTLNPSTIQLLCRRLGSWAPSLIKDIRDGTTSPPLELPASVAQAIKHLTPPSNELACRLEKLLAEDRFTPEFIWPSLAVVSCWTKAAAAFYLSDFPRYFGNTPICDITYGASEGRGTVFLSPEKQALAINSHFYEFVPEDEIGNNAPKALLCDQLQPGRNYYILFTNSAGLYRYNINDVVKVTGFHKRTPLLEFQYKGGNISSFTGEKLTELHVTEAMKLCLAELDALRAVRFFTLVPRFKSENSSLPSYELWVEPDHSGAENKLGTLAENLDRCLSHVNIEYESKRISGRLGGINTRMIKAGSYEELRRRLCAAGTPDTQIKVSHLNPKADVMDFLASNLEEGYVFDMC